MLIGQFEGAFQSALADADAFARAKVSVANPEVPDIVCVDIDRADAEVFRNFKKSRSTLFVDTGSRRLFPELKASDQIVGEVESFAEGSPELYEASFFGDCIEYTAKMSTKMFLCVFV